MKRAIGGLVLVLGVLVGCDAGSGQRQPFCSGLGTFTTCEQDLEAGVLVLALCGGADGTPIDCGMDDEGNAIVVPCPDGTLPVCE